MDEGHSTDPAETYVRVLRGFGLGDPEIVGLHRGEPGEVDPATQVRKRHAGADAPELFGQLRRGLVRSSRGVAVPVGEDLVAAADGVGEPLSTFGYDLTVSDGGATFEVGVTDAVSGLADEDSFPFPTGPLGTENVPALAAAIEELLEREALRFVLLTPGPGRWRFVLVEEDDLAELRSAFGDRVHVFGQPLLADHQPREYAGGAPTTSVYVAKSEGDTPTDSDEEISAAPGTPAWIRAAAAREGGIDELLSALTESGPRTYVSERTADDVLAEIPEFSGDGTTETRTAGIEDVLERIREGTHPGTGPSKAVSDRPIDVFDDEDRESTDGSTTDGDPRAGADPTAGSEREDRDETADEDDRDTGSGDDSLVGGGPDEVVVEGSVDDILAKRRARERDPDDERSSESAGQEPAWEPIPKADDTGEASAASPADPKSESPTSVDAFVGSGGGETDSGDEDDQGVAEFIDDAENDGLSPEEWEPVGPESKSDTPIRDAEADEESDATEGRFDGALRKSDAVTGSNDEDEASEDEGDDGVVDRIRSVWDRITSE